MSDQKLVDYINLQKGRGVSDEIIKNSLIKSGWTLNQIDEAYNTTGQTNPQLNVVSEISDKIYPIQNKLVYKQMASYIPFFIILIFFFRVEDATLNFLVYMPFIVVSILVVYLRKKMYHFELGVEHLVLHQGVLNKQQRTLQYGVIQNVLVKQDLFDRIFGIATLIIENAAGKGDLGYTKVFGIKLKTQQQKGDLIGFKGNKVSIPGLNKDDAETLKTIFLQKIKENPIEDKQSGL